MQHYGRRHPERRRKLGAGRRTHGRDRGQDRDGLVQVIVLLIGLQGSGKSSFYRHRFPEHALVSKDLMGNNRRKSARQAELIREWVGEGMSVVVDNTHVSVADRLEVIAVARELGVRVEGYYLTTAVEESYRRNLERKNPVPDVGFYGKLGQFVAPSLDEGFDRLFRVEAEGGTFLVTEDNHADG